MERRSVPKGENGCWSPVEVTGEGRGGPWVIVCDHARATVPPAVGGGGLGLSDLDMARHIAFDIGAEGVALALGEALESPVVCANFSRLVIDPNRAPGDPTLVMKLYDGSVIPANRHVDAAETDARLALCHRPYHAAIERVAGARRAPVMLSIHSFTPQLAGRPRRPWQVGVLFAHDDRLSRPLLARLRAERDLCVGENQPYKGHLPGDCMDRHALRPGRHNTLIELRNDLIATPAGQRAWAARLAPHLDAARAAVEAVRRG